MFVDSGVEDAGRDIGFTRRLDWMTNSTAYQATPANTEKVNPAAPCARARSLHREGYRPGTAVPEALARPLTHLA
jgi:hypothetical protein